MDYEAVCGACYGDGRIAEDDCQGCDGDGTVNRLRRIGGTRYIQLGEDLYDGRVSRSVVGTVRFIRLFGDRSNTTIIEDAYNDDRFSQGNRRLAWRFEQILTERVEQHVRHAPAPLQDTGKYSDLSHRYNTVEGITNGGIEEKVVWYEDLCAVTRETVDPRNEPPLDLKPLRDHVLNPPRIDTDAHRKETARGVLGEEWDAVEDWYADLAAMVCDEEDGRETVRFW